MRPKKACVRVPQDVPLPGIFLRRRPGDGAVDGVVGPLWTSRFPRAARRHDRQGHAPRPEALLLRADAGRAALRPRPRFAPGPPPGDPRDARRRGRRLYHPHPGQELLRPRRRRPPMATRHRRRRRQATGGGGKGDHLRPPLGRRRQLRPLRQGPHRLLLLLSSKRRRTRTTPLPTLRQRRLPRLFRRNHQAPLCSPHEKGSLPARLRQVPQRLLRYPQIRRRPNHLLLLQNDTQAPSEMNNNNNNNHIAKEKTSHHLNTLTLVCCEEGPQRP
mmetsp:Transcript_22558/g.72586  ORF Transcript_22558/g.72586 Transcript_22558/m.72586 type:complete len:273 (-) Transcript_22558:138-956(-)